LSWWPVELIKIGALKKEAVVSFVKLIPTNGIHGFTSQKNVVLSNMSLC